MGTVSHNEYADFIVLPELLRIIVSPSQVAETKWLFVYCSALLRELAVTEPRPDIPFCYYVPEFTPSLRRDIPFRYVETNKKDYHSQLYWIVFYV